MTGSRRVLAVTELVLILPAVLFLAAVLARNLEPLYYAAQQIVLWYSERLWTLWILLIALPLGALLIGCSALLSGALDQSRGFQGARGRSESIRLSPLTAMIVATTSTCGLILAVVILHMLAN